MTQLEKTGSSDLEKPQILTHIIHRLSTFTAYDVKWLPSSAKIVVLGQHARGTGALQIFELDDGALKLIRETEKQVGFKCGTFGASTMPNRHLATGDFEGRLAMWDLERLELPVFSIKAHSDIINCIDGCGGFGSQHGPPEIATGSRDGCVKVWDVRQRDRPVADIAPSSGQQQRDTWCVAFGNSYNDEERCLAAGYDNGDIKMFDLRAMKLLWETNLKNGVCGLEFDRKDIMMNKLVATTLEASYTVFDLRTHHPKHGFASITERAHDGTTIWTVRHLPQNRDLFMTSGGDGCLNLHKYNYPPRRNRKDADGLLEGVPGTVSVLNATTVAEQPVASLDWNLDKPGLCAFASFDQTIRIGIVTKLGQY